MAFRNYINFMKLAARNVDVSSMQFKNLIKIFLIGVLVIKALIFINSYKHESKESEMDYTNYDFPTDTKYILQWTDKTHSPFEFLEERDEAFVKNKCKYTNCFITDNKHFFLDKSDFDAIIFNGMDLSRLYFNDMARKNRTVKQKYIFAAMESADNFPICDKEMDGLFNWTWTYKLDSDFVWTYMTIYDLNGSIVGPKINVDWVKDMKPIDRKLKIELSNKTKAAVWFVSNCWTKSLREVFVDELRRELHKFRLTVDIFGDCGRYKCKKGTKSRCFSLIARDYYFYLSFENSFSEDYVTEKLTTALNNYAVPIVYGGANYSRFLPEHSYLNARLLGINELARKINKAIHNRSMYYDFFRWRNHYRYVEGGRKDVCKLCAMMNNERKLTEISVWTDFRRWWNGHQYKRNCYQFL